MKTLFCTDGSEASYNAISRAIPFLKPESKLDIINVMETGLFTTTFVTFPYETESGFSEVKSISEEILEKTRSFLEQRGININQTFYSSGHPDQVILEAIQNGFYDMVIMGSHGKRGIEKWLGSVSKKVVTKSSIPVFVAKSTETGEIRGERILFAVDGSECSKKAIEKALTYLNLPNPAIEIVVVYPGPEVFPIEISMDARWLEECILSQKQLAIEILEEAEKIVQSRGFEVQQKLALEGEAAFSILNHLEKSPKDLVVMGSHGRSGISDFLLGSVSKRVLDNSNTSTFIVPLHQEITK